MRAFGFLLLWCASIVAIAQSYRPMLTAGAAWQDENAWASPGPNTSQYYCCHYFLDGDSIVNDTTYSILRQNVFIMPGAQWLLGQFVALLREDTLERRVYIRPYVWPIEFLLYDFSVGAGLYPDTWRFSEPPTITDVDTVLLSDGPHPRLLVGPDWWITEGIGCITGFLPSLGMGEIHWLEQLVCHTVQDSANYEIYSLDCPCGIYVDIAETSIEQPTIGPSPTSGICWLQGAPANSPYRVCALDGRTVRTGTCDPSGSTVIDLTTSTTGTYFVAILADAGPFRIKVMKQ
jgi:hypothetical protein